MAKPDSSFKYRIGQWVTPRPPADRPPAGRFEVVSQLLQATPSGPQRFYYLRRTEQSDRGSAASSPTLRLLEEQVAPLGQKGQADPDGRPPARPGASSPHGRR